MGRGEPESPSKLKRKRKSGQRNPHFNALQNRQERYARSVERTTPDPSQRYHREVAKVVETPANMDWRDAIMDGNDNLARRLQESADAVQYLASKQEESLPIVLEYVDCEHERYWLVLRVIGEPAIEPLTALVNNPDTPPQQQERIRDELAKLQRHVDWMRANGSLSS